MKEEIDRDLGGLRRSEKVKEEKDVGREMIKRSESERERDRHLDLD